MVQNREDDVYPTPQSEADIVTVLHDIREHAARTEEALTELIGVFSRLVERLTPHMERLERASKTPAGRLFLGRLGG